MELSFLRHGDAENHAPSDFDRKLTDKGIKDISRLGALLSKTEASFDIIFSSPLIRAIETAEIIANTLDIKYHIVQETRLECGAHLLDIKAILKEYSSHNKILFVGHAPDMGYITSELLNVNNKINFKKGSILKMETSFIREGSATLIYFLTSNMYTDKTY